MRWKSCGRRKLSSLSPCGRGWLARSDSEREPGEGLQTIVRLSPLTRPRSASPPLGHPLPRGEREARARRGSHQFVSAGRNFLTSASLGNTVAPSTYLNSVIVPLPFSSAILPT